MDRLTYLLAQLSERERALLLVLVMVVVPLGVAFLGVIPLLQAREAARLSAFEAKAMLGWVAEQVETLPAEGLASNDVSQPPEPIGISGIEQTLVRDGLRDRVSQLSNRAGGGVNLDFDAIPFDQLTAWLAGTTPNWGYRIASFRIERTPDAGLVAAAFELEARQ